MRTIRNPFRATLGASPPALVGREEILDDFRYGLQNGPGTHERISLVTGPRGVGKTVLLNELQNVAGAEGWRVFAVSAGGGFVDDLRNQVYRAIEADLRENQSKLTGITLGGLGLTWGKRGGYVPEPTLRDVLTALFRMQEETDTRVGQAPTGVLITVDELHYLNRDEVISFATTIQHLVREEKEIAVAMAGIPSSVKPLLASDEGRNPITFLRRANRIELGAVRDDEVETALRDPVRDAGGSWESDALAAAVSATGGYPFMIQLVGDHSFRSARDARIDVAAVSEGIAKAQRRLGQSVHEPALNDLSDIDRTFLVSMALDEGPSRTAEIADRLGVSRQYVNNYRERLLQAGMIKAPKRGEVDFELPYMRDYLREHAAAYGLNAVLDNLGNRINNFKQQ